DGAMRAVTCARRETSRRARAAATFVDQTRAGLLLDAGLGRFPLPFHTIGGLTTNRPSSRRRPPFHPSWYSSASSGSVAGCRTPCAPRNWIASSEARVRTQSHGVPRANWSEIAPMRPVLMLIERVTHERIGPDQ